MTVAMGHPDAMIALQNKYNGVTAHFSQPPYQDQELAMPGVHEVLDLVAVMGGPLTNGCVYSTTAFHDANPKIITAFVGAIKEAIALIEKDKRAAAGIYLEINKESVYRGRARQPDRAARDGLLRGPENLLPAAQFFSRAGYIKQKPTSWKEFFFEEVHDLPGS